jgi:Xaa-Pro aminopeptidase
MDRGEVIVIDAAARCGGYTSDITRTLPVSGKFTPRQREIYEIVLGAQKAAIAAIKPGATISSLNSTAREYINTHGKDLKGNSLGKYLPHGISHHVGLDVHDPSGAATLAPGMVITVEPGIYIPEEGIGIRIEDTVLVTENGAKVMSGALPKEPDEVEKALAK